MCGLPGAGKTTYAMELVRRGCVRLSIDEVVWRRLGQRDAGVVLQAEAFYQLKEVADRTTLERRLEARNGEEGANSVTVNEELFIRYPAEFEEPHGQGEQVFMQSSA